MKILIIGGTKFLGRHLVKAVLHRDHEVTLFNRGNQYSYDPVPDVLPIQGDRHRDLGKLENMEWDAVIDTCGYLPQSVAASAEFLKDKVGQYVFISSGSVYSDTAKANYDETTETKVLSEEQKKAIAKIDLRGDITGAVLGDHYGALKVLCEQAAENAISKRVLNVRAGMIVGEFDWTDRFTYWVMRIARGGEVLAPDSPENHVQLIDACDLSNWIVRAIETNTTGTLNVSGGPFDLNFGSMLNTISGTCESDARLTWVSEKFLTQHDVSPWVDMPFYLPVSDEETRNFLTMNVDKARAAGLVCRPLSETVLDIWNWRKSVGGELQAGINDKRELELLAIWHEQNS